MVLRRTESGWAVLAPAKLNLSLEVLGRRDDGYHEVETLNVPIRLYDELFLQTAAAPADSSRRFELRIESSGNADSVPSGEDNLVIRALETLARRAGCPQGAAITLRKRIPAMAGLGGGSSDAAAALSAANAAWGLSWSVDRLSPVAAEIGSDVPFFLHGGAAICRGRGERIEPVALPAGLPCVIVQPPTGMSTPDVYARLDANASPDSGSDSRRLARLLAAIRSGDWRNLASGLYNRLQSAAAEISPEVHRLAAAFGRLPFIAHQLTGSGAAHFGLCRHLRQANDFAATLSALNLGRVFVTTTGS